MIHTYTMLLHKKCDNNYHGFINYDESWFEENLFYVTSYINKLIDICNDRVKLGYIQRYTEKHDILSTKQFGTVDIPLVELKFRIDETQEDDLVKLYDYICHKLNQGAGITRDDGTVICRNWYFGSYGEENRPGYDF